MKLLLKRKTAAEWSSQNPILSLGEPGWDSTNNVFKIGNGVDTWSALDPISGEGGGGGLDLGELHPILDGYATDGELSSHTGDSSIHFTAASLNLAQYVDHTELDSALDGYALSSEIVSDHGSLSGLSDDDHPQYLNTSRLNPILDGYATDGELTAHTGDSSIHFTAASLNLGQYVDHSELDAALDGYVGNSSSRLLPETIGTDGYILTVSAGEASWQPANGLEASNGLPSGGSSGQILAKIDATNFNAEWIDNVGGGLDLGELEPILDGYATQSAFDSHTGDSSIHFTAASLNLGQYVDHSELHTALDGYVSTSSNRLIPSGGGAGEVLTKNSASDYDLSWAAPSVNIGSLAYNIVLSSNHTTSGIVVSNVPDLVFTPQANKRYLVSLWCYTATAVGGTGPRVGVNFPAGTAVSTGANFSSNNATASAQRWYHDGLINNFAASTGHAVADVEYLSYGHFLIDSGASPTGSLSVFLLSELDNADVVTMRAGSFLRVEVINEGISLGYLTEIFDGYAAIDHTHSEYLTTTTLDSILDGYATDAALTAHTGDSTIHFTAASLNLGQYVDHTELDSALDGYALSSAIITDHGALSGLSDDDHPQYYNSARLDTILDGYVDTSSNRLIPSGGSSGQVLAKASATNYDVEWVAASGGGDDGYLFASYKIEDHFLGTGLNQAQTWTQQVSGAGAQNATLTSAVLGAPGVMRMSTGTTSTGRSSLYITPSTGTNIRLGGGLAYDWQARVRISYVADGTETYELITGLTTSVGSGSEVHSIGFVINSSSANWICRTNDNFNVTNTGSGVAISINTWYYLRFVVNAAATEALFYIDNTLVATVTSNIPTSTTPFSDGLLVAQRIFKSAGTSNVDFDIDYIGLRIYQ